jgi:hypothetical protein
MAQIQYLIVDESIGTYAVEIRDPHETPYRTDGFRSKEQANAWIQRQKQKAAAGDLWEATQIDRRHKDE